VQQTYSTPGPISAYVEVGAGELLVTGSDTDITTVAIDGPRAHDFHVALDGRVLSVVAPKGRLFGSGDSHRVSVTVPAGSDLSLKAGSADTAVSGTLGMLKLKTGSGDVEVERTDGPFVVESGSGDVTAHELNADARIKSGSGDVDLGEVRGSLGVSTGSGDVVLGSVHGKAVVKTGSGDLQVNRSDSDVALSTASGDLVIGRATRGRVIAKNVSGDVRVGIPAGTPVWTDISTVTGGVANRLESVGKPAEGQEHVEVRATTVSGDVVLQSV
jgi:DUF4097 and DUF4098 domain-containing protein YvlB